MAYDLPGGLQVTRTDALSGEPPGRLVTVTLTGGGGTVVEEARVVILAFCARLEKLLLREDMYLIYG